MFREFQTVFDIELYYIQFDLLLSSFRFAMIKYAHFYKPYHLQQQKPQISAHREMVSQMKCTVITERSMEKQRFISETCDWNDFAIRVGVHSEYLLDLFSFRSLNWTKSGSALQWTMVFFCAALFSQSNYFKRGKIFHTNQNKMRHFLLANQTNQIIPRLKSFH